MLAGLKGAGAKDLTGVVEDLAGVEGATRDFGAAGVLVLVESEEDLASLASRAA